MQLTNHKQLKPGMRVKVLTTRWQHFDVFDLPGFDRTNPYESYIALGLKQKDVDNCQYKKPVNLYTDKEEFGTIVSDDIYGIALVLDSKEYRLTNLKNMKKAGYVSAPAGGTPYKGVWYYSTNKVVEIVD